MLLSILRLSIILKNSSPRARDRDTINIIVYYTAIVNSFFKISFYFFRFFLLSSEYAKNREKDKI